jgi:hypothetical protein
MKLVFVQEFDVEQHQLERLVKQVSQGLSGLRDIQMGALPISRCRRETFMAINDDAETIITMFRKPEPEYEQLTLFDPTPYETK